MKMDAKTVTTVKLTTLDYSHYEQLLNDIQSINFKHISNLHENKFENNSFSSYMAILKESSKLMEDIKDDL